MGNPFTLPTPGLRLTDAMRLQDLPVGTLIVDRSGSRAVKMAWGWFSVPPHIGDVS